MIAWQEARRETQRSINPKGQRPAAALLPRAARSGGPKPAATVWLLDRSSVAGFPAGFLGRAKLESEMWAAAAGAVPTYNTAVRRRAPGHNCTGSDARCGITPFVRARVVRPSADAVGVLVVAAAVVAAARATAHRKPAIIEIRGGNWLRGVGGRHWRQAAPDTLRFAELRCDRINAGAQQCKRYRLLLRRGQRLL